MSKWHVLKDSNFNLLPPWKPCSKQQCFRTQLLQNCITYLLVLHFHLQLLHQTHIKIDRRSRRDSTNCWTVQVLYHPTRFISIRPVLPFSNRLMVEPKGVAPSKILHAKQTPLLHSDHGPIKISFTHQSCLQASILTTSL